MKKVAVEVLYTATDKATIILPDGLSQFDVQNIINAVMNHVTYKQEVQIEQDREHA